MIIIISAQPTSANTGDTELLTTSWILNSSPQSRHKSRSDFLVVPVLSSENNTFLQFPLQVEGETTPLAAILNSELGVLVGSSCRSDIRGMGEERLLLLQLPCVPSD